MHIISNKGVTLTEILLAVFIMAMAFIPIVGVMGTSMRFTMKENSTITAMNIAQDKLDTALNFEFDFFDANNHLDSGWITTNLQSGNLELALATQTIAGVDYFSQLKVEDRPGSFTVPVRSFDDIHDMSTWKFATSTIDYTGLVHRYTLKVKWKDRGEDSEKFYRLVTFRAKLRTGG